MGYTHLYCTNDNWELRMDYSSKQQYTKYPYYLVSEIIPVKADIAIS